MTAFAGKNMSTMMLIVLCIVLLVVFSEAAKGKKNMFAICDKNDDSKITRAELAVCMNILPELDTIESNTNTKVAQLMDLIDKNNDGHISATEFQKATEKANEAFELDEYIEVTKADGTIQKVHKSELFHPMSGSEKGFEMKNEKIYKQNSESGSIAELTKKDPALGNMIRVGNWTAMQLVALNFTTGLLLNLESLPRGGSVVDKERLDREPELLGVVFNGQFEVWLKLKIGSVAEGKISYFEARVEYNREKYRAPYLALLEAWPLQTGKGRGGRDVRMETLELPPPRMKERFVPWFYSEVTRYLSHPYAGIIAAIFAALFIATIFI